MSMNIYAPHGTKVVYTGQGGYDSEKEYADKWLELGREYTIDYTEVHPFNTDVFLVEMPDKKFNSVHFEELKPVKSITQFTDEELISELNKRKREREEDEMKTLPDNYYSYDEIHDLRYDDKYQYFVVHVDDGSEGFDCFLQVESLELVNEDEDEILFDTIKHYWISRSLKEGWNLRIDEIHVNEFSPYGGGVFLKINANEENIAV